MAPSHGPTVDVVTGERDVARAFRVLRLACARGLALFLGGFGLLNVLLGAVGRGLDRNVWWVDLHWLPAWANAVVVGACAAALLAFGLRPRMATWRRTATAGVAALLTLIALENCVQFYLVWSHGLTKPAVPVPLSLLLAAALGWLAWVAARAQVPAVHAGAPLRSRLGPPLLTAAVLLVCVLAFPLLQMVFFGTTDYRRPADVIVVLGAQVHENGQASASLVERVDTAIDLFRQGYAPLLIVSGGRGDGGVHEALAMRDLAIAGGVPADAVQMDMHGVNTQATVRDTVSMLEASGSRRVLVVSHFYHLARIKLAYAAQGLDVWTVPTERARWLPQLPWIVAREMAAFWVYYVRGAGL